MKGGVNWVGRTACGAGERVEIVEKLRGQRGAEFEAFAGARMREGDASGVEEISAERRQQLFAHAFFAGGTVDSVTYDRA